MLISITFLQRKFNNHYLCILYSEQKTNSNVVYSIYNYQKIIVGDLSITKVKYYWLYIKTTNFCVRKVILLQHNVTLRKVTVLAGNQRCGIVAIVVWNWRIPLAGQDERNLHLNSPYVLLCLVCSKKGEGLHANHIMAFSSSYVYLGTLSQLKIIAAIFCFFWLCLIIQL
jgi:hypothetical protein